MYYIGIAALTLLVEVAGIGAFVGIIYCYDRFTRKSSKKTV